MALSQPHRFAGRGHYAKSPAAKNSRGDTRNSAQIVVAITITLDAPYISSNTPDMDRSGVLEDNNTNLFNRFSVDEIDDFKAKCIEAGEAQALEGGIMDDARVNAEENLAAMFNAALGDEYTVEFVWREE